MEIASQSTSKCYRRTNRYVRVSIDCKLETAYVTATMTGIAIMILIVRAVAVRAVADSHGRDRPRDSIEDAHYSFESGACCPRCRRPLQQVTLLGLLYYYYDSYDAVFGFARKR